MALGGNLKKNKVKSSAPKEKTKAAAKPKKAEINEESNIPLNVEVKEKVEVVIPSNAEIENKPRAKADVAVNENLSSEDVASEKAHMLIAFPVENEEYAVSIDVVKEVVPTPTITPIPQAPNYIKGVANVRGNVLAVIDVAEKVGITHKREIGEQKKSNYVLVIQHEEYQMAISVDKVPDTITVNESDIDRSDSIVMQTNLEETYIEGVVKVDDRMIILIDIIDMIAEKEINSE